MKKILLPLAIVIIAAIGVYYYSTERAVAPMQDEASTATSTNTSPTPATTGNPTVVTDSGEQNSVAITQNATISLTEADNGKTVSVKKGTRVVLALGEDVWTISMKPAGILNRIKNLAVIRGVQGIYTADTVGTTQISAEGRPNCDPGAMCAQYIKNFDATVKVTN
jgi:hypothetical protein